MSIDCQTTLFPAAGGSIELSGAGSAGCVYLSLIVFASGKTPPRKEEELPTSSGVQLWLVLTAEETDQLSALLGLESFKADMAGAEVRSDPMRSFPDRYRLDMILAGNGTILPGVMGTLVLSGQEKAELADHLGSTATYIRQMRTILIGQEESE